LIFVNYLEFIESMNLTRANDIITLNEEGESTKFADDILVHCVFGLLGDNLVYPFLTGGRGQLSKKYEGIKNHGMVVGPTPLGAELYLWANGKGHVGINDFFRNDVNINFLDNISLPISSKATLIE